MLPNNGPPLVRVLPAPLREPTTDGAGNSRSVRLLYRASETDVRVVTMLPPSVVRIAIAATETSARISEYSTSACPSSLRIEAIHARIQIHLLPPTIERPLLRGTRGRLACVSHENHDSSDDRTRLEPDNPP